MKKVVIEKSSDGKFVISFFDVTEVLKLEKLVKLETVESIGYSIGKIITTWLQS